ncbi:hypothetical protein HNQ02_001018 [Flavobacterium sp. 7E]|uniref:hypothetical protein n=1 Tax=Flavobacterium sp. 7E TaxID=2735898 RepID=UPI00156F6ED1|nr:hypothetical protein [Flavobacterium sp. 7E]NRS88104.1 hypothetical protein [Flavobacterium sp. 7E]
MRKTTTLSLFIIFIFALESCRQDIQSKSNISALNDETEVRFAKNKIDSAEANKVFKVPTLRNQYLVNGYKFNLPFNYRMVFIPSEKNTKDHYYKFQWKINESFSINSDLKDFKRFSISNLIEYIPSSSNEEGEIYIVSSNKSSKLKTSDFIQEADEVLYKDENSAIFKMSGKIQAFYFEFLPETQEYLIYLSDTPFWNISPEPNVNEEIDQLLHQLRLAKNISNPIIKQKNEWDSLNNQLSILEKNFLQKIISETKNIFTENSETQSYAPTNQGNIPYFTVFKENSNTDLIWKKLHSKNGTKALTISEAESEFEYLRNNNFRFFYYSDYTQINKSEYSVVYKRNSPESYCLITKPKKQNVVIFKEFPASMFMTLDYYKNEIEFYRILFENY